MLFSRFSSPVLLSFVVTSKGGEEGERVDTGSRFLLSFISHFSPASKDDIDVNTYFIRHYGKHLMHALYFLFLKQSSEIGIIITVNFIAEYTASAITCLRSQQQSRNLIPGQ